MSTVEAELVNENRADKKRCYGCHVLKSLSDFYPHRQMRDGHVGKCKACTRLAVRDREQKLRATNPDWVMKERERGRIKAKIKRYKRKDASAYSKRWAEKHPTKKRVHHKVSNALRDRKLLRPTACIRCGATGRVEAHHEDYSKPFYLEWLCSACHGKTRRLPPPIIKL